MLKVKFHSALAFHIKLKDFFRHKHVNKHAPFICFPYPIYCIEIWDNASTIPLEPHIKIQIKIFEQ